MGGGAGNRETKITGVLVQKARLRMDRQVGRAQCAVVVHASEPLRSDRILRSGFDTGQIVAYTEHTRRFLIEEKVLWHGDGRDSVMLGYRHVNYDGSRLGRVCMQDHQDAIFCGPLDDDGGDVAAALKRGQLATLWARECGHSAASRARKSCSSQRRSRAKL